MFTRWLCLPLCALLVGLSSQTLTAAVIANGDFSDYGPVSPPAYLNTLPVHGWSETGTGGHSLVGQSFGAWSGLGNSVLLTTVGEGIRQKISGFTAGNTYVFDTAYHQSATNLHPTVSVWVFHGDSIDPGQLLASWDYTLDAHVYGDGLLSSRYVGFFTPTSDTVTLLYTLKAKDGPNDLGPMVAVTEVDLWIPEPSSTALLLGGAVTLLAIRRRR